MNSDKRITPTIDDLLNLPVPSDARLSPNGRHVVYVVTTPDWAENRYVSQLWLVAVPGGDGEKAPPQQLTFSDNGSSAPRWSPDGVYIAFLSERAGDAATQLYRLAAFGGEAERLTQSETTIERFAWSPDGATIAYVATEPESKADKARKKQYGDYHVEDEDDRCAHLWQIGMDARKPRQLTHGSDLHVGEFDWSPDGQRIALVGYPSPRVNDGRFGRIYLLHVASQRQRAISEAESARPLWSPDGKQLAYLQASPSAGYKNAKLTLLTLKLAAEGDSPVQASRVLGEAFDEQMRPAFWREDGFYFLATQRTEAHLLRLDIATGEVEPLTTDGPPGWMISSATASKRPATESVALVAASATRLDEVIALPITGGAPIYLTDFQSATAAWPLGENEVIQWTSEDGTTIEGVLTKPRDFDPTQPHPLLVVIHGGPTSTSFTAQLGRYERRYYPIQQWVAKGALVLQPNYRGSEGYGEAFRSLNVRNLGVGDAQDVLSGVEALIERGWVDPARMGVMGWSQGGYISAFLATGSDRFQAVSVGAGISNWMTYYVSTDVHRFTQQYLEATPWDDAEIYAKTSPITRIQQAQTPTLIQHGEFDRRVPIPNAYELYQGLQDVGVETKLVVYKEMGHGIDKPRLNRQVMEENWKWFSRLWPEEETGSGEPQPWRTLSSHTAFANRWLTVVVDEVELANGQSYEYTKLEPPGIGVGVIGFNAAGEVLLEREYRHGVGEVIWQLPGGLANEGESLQEAALRELREETGYAPASINGEVDEQTVRHLGAVWDNPGLGAGQSQIFAVWGLEAVGGEKPDEAEAVSLHWQTVDWLKEAVRSGEIRDRFVVGALAQLWLNGLIEEN